MATLASSLREAEPDGDSIYNHILNEIDTTPEPVFARPVITVQPYYNESSAQRLPMPLLTASRHLPILPLYGLQLLADVEELQIHRTIDLNDLYSMAESAGKYVVKADGREIIYGGTEGSTPWQRLLCCSSRRFILRLFDRTNQEALYFIRRLAPTSPWLSFYLQRMDIFLPPCDYIGCIQQKWDPSAVRLVIRNYVNEDIFEVKGPLCTLCATYREMEFDVIGLQVTQSVSKISHRWDESRAMYVLNIFFNLRLDNTRKALILACAFLLEYIYFHVDGSAGPCVCLK